MDFWELVAIPEATITVTVPHAIVDSLNADQRMIWGLVAPKKSTQN